MSNTEHVDDVRAIVQRAVKDLIIEQSLKTYEEVWLSKIFELRDHIRNRLIASTDKTVVPEPVGVSCAFIIYLSLNSCFIRSGVIDLY